MLDQDRILQYIGSIGPTTPSKIAKVINTDTLLASAHLSDLASQKKVKISSVKIGGTPLYYLPGQEERLYQFAQGNINPKDHEVLEMLKVQRVLREVELELLPRVALRGLKDFAIPFNVTIGGQTELFWKFYLVSEAERDQMVKQMLTPVEEKREEGRVELPMSEAQGAAAGVQEEVTFGVTQIGLGGEHIEKQRSLVEQEGEIRGYSEKVGQRAKPKRKRVVVAETFLEDIEDHFKKLKIIIEQKETVKKNGELNLFVKVPSVVGTIRYFCKAKNKSKCDEKDLSLAYMEAQIKKLPLLFLYTDELAKKAQEMLDSGAFENMVVRKME